LCPGFDNQRNLRGKVETAKFLDALGDSLSLRLIVACMNTREGTSAERKHSQRKRDKSLVHAGLPATSVVWALSAFGHQKSMGGFAAPSRSCMRYFI
jgi:hypothetical protein